MLNMYAATKDNPPLSPISQTLGGYKCMQSCESKTCCLPATEKPTVNGTVCQRAQTWVRIHGYQKSEGC